MVVISGPNGAGKSTLYDTVIRPAIAPLPFINADVLQRQYLGSDPAKAYEAAQLATQEREYRLMRGESFVTETVFSHPSKLALVSDAQAAGFSVAVYHVGVTSATLAIARVRHRVQEGGHPVPDDKVRERYDRNGPLIRDAMMVADRGYVYDNSRLNQTPRRLMTFKAGTATYVTRDLPGWAIDIYGPPDPSA